MTLIVGLGNPGDKYAGNRHNIGFMVIDRLIERLEARDVSKSAFEGECYKAKNYLLLKPGTYMNNSGKSVLAVKNFFKPEDVIVIHDELDLNFGGVKMKRGGGHGGHNGLRSLDEYIGKGYIRLRMGIGKPEHKSQVISHVLSDFNEEEQKVLSQWIEHCADAALQLCEKEVNEVASTMSAKSIENVV